ncbi:hypothetical protein [Novosphingobium huizhouense]|uniref:hypothetical protein n=1 Tax=Novosphingobium huizhouense TaxID=2866625 RepID=UPI001CD89371|nr:hypothetical protein [Novosphingobium huizhouense]
MDHGTLALLIPLAPFMLAGFAIWTRHNRKVEEIRAQNTAEKAAQYAAQNQALEERVRVLERIVTDGGYDVATQIEALRDVRRLEDRPGQTEGHA